MKRFFNLILVFLMTYVIYTAGCSLDKTALIPSAAADSDASAPIAIDWYFFPLFTQTELGYGQNTADTDLPPDHSSYEQYIVQKFEEQNPDIKIHLHPLDYITGPDNLRYALETGTCDIILDAPGRLIAYGRDGLLEPLPDFFSHDFLQDIQDRRLIDACQADGIFYVYPFSTTPFYMAFNKEYAQAAGVLPLIHQGWTIADFKAALSGLHKAGYVPGSIFCSGSVGDATRALVSNLSGTPVINDDFSHYTLTDGAESINVLAFLQQAVKDGLLTDGSLLSGRKDIQRFIDGKTAFTILWSGTQQSSSQAELDSHHIETIEIPFPAQAGHQPQLEYLINGFAIGKAHDKEKLAAAKRFIHYICDDSQMGRMSVLASGSIPVRKSFANLIAISHRQQLADWTEYYAPYYNIVPGFEKMRNIWYTTLQAMLRDDMSPQEAAASFTRAADATLVLPAKVVQP